jgi:hypothetical protein
LLWSRELIDSSGHCRYFCPTAKLYLNLNSRKFLILYFHRNFHPHSCGVLKWACQYVIKWLVICNYFHKMGWVDSPPFFCTTTEMCQDIAMQYCNTKVGSLNDQKFAPYQTGNKSLNPSTTQTLNGHSFISWKFMWTIVPG